MFNPNWIILTSLLTTFGGLTYLIKTIKGEVKPNRVSWFLWAAAPLIAFAAELKQGVGLQSLMTFSVGFNPLMVFIGSFVNKKSFWKLGRLDFICGILALVGLILWQITKIGNIAIMFSILADGIASVPMIVKSWQAPETEDYKIFFFAMINGLVTLLTLTTWDFIWS
jgi:hypothetical protein